SFKEGGGSVLKVNAEKQRVTNASKTISGVFFMIEFVLRRPN
ncbi:MAG: hypothetical protein ACI9Z3_002127, partial [Roseivirga sp.]